MKIIDGLKQDNEIYDKQIKNNTYLLKIKYNQNYTIQGTIHWLEQKKTIYFRSLMELVLLLQEASSINIDFHNWNGKSALIKEFIPPAQSTGSNVRENKSDREKA